MCARILRNGYDDLRRLVFSRYLEFERMKNIVVVPVIRILLYGILSERGYRHLSIVTVEIPLFTLPAILVNKANVF